MRTHNNTLSNLIRGVTERVMFTNSRRDKPLSPKKKVFVDRLASYRKSIVAKLRFSTPVTRREFADYYKGSKFKIYTEAVDSLELRSTDVRDAVVKTFVKAEKLNFTLKDDPAPRVIQPRRPRYNVEVGRYLRPLEKRLYEEIDNLFGSPTIFSSYNSYQQARELRKKWNSFRNPVCIGLDASRFDQHVSVQALKFEHSVYDGIFNSKELRSLLHLQLENRCVAVAADGWFHYVKRGSRMSGDINTSMGNKLLMCLMGKAFIDSKNVRIEFVNNGDDCLLILEKAHIRKLDNLDNYFRDFGFNIVREDAVSEFEQIEFCQTKPVISNGVWRMVRNVKTCLSKDITCVNLGHRTDQYRHLLYDIAHCGLTTCADVPILGSFYRMLKRFGIEGSYTGKHASEYSYYHISSRGATCRANIPDDEGRYSFWLSTGISPDAQEELEKYFDESVWGGDKRQIINDFNLLYNG